MHLQNIGKMYPNKWNKDENISSAFFKNYVYNALQYTIYKTFSR